MIVDVKNYLQLVLTIRDKNGSIKICRDGHQNSVTILNSIPKQ